MDEGDTEPLKPVSHGGGHCKHDRECGRGGHCVRKACDCKHTNYTGPFCRVTTILLLVSLPFFHSLCYRRQ